MALITVLVMCCWNTLVLSVLVQASWCLDDLTFPPGFKFGAATSAYQIEGAWNVSGLQQRGKRLNLPSEARRNLEYFLILLCDLKFSPGFTFKVASAYQVEGVWNISDKGESNWDRMTHDHPDLIAGGSNGDVACDSYVQWRRDVQMAADLGLHHYRFSISWSRLLPTGYTNHVSKEGAAYYNNLIDELLRNGIEPMVTIFHFDLPHNLQVLGGWTNPLSADWFADYSRVVFSLYADRVNTWLTINEPIIICDYTYNNGKLPPLLVETELAPYLCNKNVLIAHARAWRIYDEEFRQKFHGQVSIVNHLVWYQPVNPTDSKLAELALQHSAGRYSHPIYSKEGGWPPATEELMAVISKAQGFNKSRLPSFTEEEQQLVRGTYDFYAMNYYTSREVRPAEPGETVGSWFFAGWPDMDAVLVQPEECGVGASNIFSVYPIGIRHLLAWLNKEYGDISILITENGYYDFGESLVDEDRIDFIEEHLKQVLLSIKEDEVNVTGYTLWSLLDNFEWTKGYSSKFGLYEVDFDDPARPRRPRKSAYYYGNVIKKNSLNIPEDYYALRGNSVILN